MTTAIKPLSKAQRFANSAEALGDWTVERRKDQEGNRTVIATRGDEVFTFTWQPNPGGRGSLKFAGGVHSIGEHSEEYANVKGALRLMAEPAGVVRIEHKAPRRSAPGEPTRRRVVRIPFDPATSEDKEILAACAGKRVTWLNTFSGMEETGMCPRGGIHYRIDPSVSGDPAERVLTFCDQSHLFHREGTAGFRSVRLDAIKNVSVP
jgi:hypothetical protein